MPMVTWALDRTAAYGADQGIEFRYPFLDSRLVNFMLSVPFEHRLAGTCSRWLHRQALRPILPPAIADRMSKPGFSRAVIEWGRRSRPAIEEVLQGSEWLSDRFVDRDQVRRLLARLDVQPASAVEAWDGWRDVRSIVNIEVWRRTVLGYPVNQEALPMAEVLSPGERPSVDGNAEGGMESRPAPPYVTPKLVSIGNVAELVAVNVGTGIDGSPVPGNDHA
jgi:hypothetical protein